MLDDRFERKGTHICARQAGGPDLPLGTGEAAGHLDQSNIVDIAVLVVAGMVDDLGDGSCLFIGISCV